MPTVTSQATTIKPRGALAEFTAKRDTGEDYVEATFTVEFMHHRGFRGSWYEPAEPAEIELWGITLESLKDGDGYGLEITPEVKADYEAWVEAYRLEDLETACQEEWESE